MWQNDQMGAWPSPEVVGLGIDVLVSGLCGLQAQCKIKESMSCVLCPPQDSAVASPPDVVVDDQLQTLREQLKESEQVTTSSFIPFQKAHK